ncbi:putative zinc finger/helix-turn-helix protein, YgiT family [Fusobacterium necrophorum subsp. necrophorum]|nr:putative zinc finger/helix-turn-helix protein, YgiT family [Fusobacterium necrophorum subsp. necrophorum]
MPKKTIQGNKELAKQIKLRRNELGLTIEEAASRANVGTKTWSRYESGSSIRIDKCKGICKALNWHTIPNQKIADNKQFSIQEYKNHEAWSEFLYNTFGLGAAVSFVIVVIYYLTTSMGIWKN